MAIPYRGEIYSILAALLWALAVVLFKRSGERLRPLTLNFFKGTVGTLLFLVTLLLLGDDLMPRVSGTDYLRLALSGIVGLTVADTLFLRSLNLLGAGISQIVACLYSPFVILFSLLFLGEHVSGGDLCGTGLILSGVILTYERRRAAPGAGRRTEGLVLGALAFAFMALGVVLAKPALGQCPIVWATAFRLVVGTMALALLTPFLPNRREIWRSLLPSRDWKLALPPSVIGTYLAMLAWLAGIKYTTASSAAILNQSSAVFILPLAAALLGEPVTRRKLLALSLALAGVALVTLQ